MTRLLAAALASLAFAATPAYGANAERDIGYLNEERAAHGLPAGITEDPEWSQRCVQHNEYQRQNGGQLTHEEDPSKPGYTEGGAWAGQSSVLSAGPEWAPGFNPWDEAPIHLIQLYTPALDRIGIDDSDGLTCATTFPGMTRAPFAEHTIHTYPGDGAVGFAPSQLAQESPFVPGDFVGLPQGTVTGRHIFVYLDIAGQTGPAQVTIGDASLAGPGGPVDVRWVDNSTAEIGPYLTGGVMIPAPPLAGGTEYAAAVTVDGPDGPLTKSWSYTTSGSPPTLTRVRRRGRGVGFELGCGPVACDAQAKLTAPSGANAGKGAAVVDPGARQSFRVALNARGRRLLRRAGKLRVQLRVRFTVPGGSAPLKRRVTLRG
jgi:hypothetical protein